MSEQEKNIYAAITSTLLVAGLYCMKMFEMHHEKLFSGEGAASLMGKSLLLLVVANVVANMIVRIVFSLIFSIATKTCETSHLDERDKTIELKGMQVSYMVFAIGLMFSLGALALGWSPLIVINLIVLCLILGEIASGITKLYQYRRGY